jgi:hypothetical protein
MDLQTGGGTPVSKFKVAKDGIITIPYGSIQDAVGSTGTNVVVKANKNIYLWVGSPNRYVSITTDSFPTLAFNPSITVDTSDLFVSRKAGASLQFGQADAAAPVAQTIGVQSVVAGTSNTAGQNFTVRGSQGTGTGVGGDIIFQVAAAGSSGTAQNALATAMRVYNTKTVAVGSAFTVATLPAAGTQGRRAWVTDALAPTFLGALTGGGAVVSPVFDNGTAWVAG